MLCHSKSIKGRNFAESLTQTMLQKPIMYKFPIKMKMPTEKEKDEGNNAYKLSILKTCFRDNLKE